MCSLHGDSYAGSHEIIIYLYKKLINNFFIHLVLYVDRIIIQVHKKLSDHDTRIFQKIQKYANK